VDDILAPEVLEQLRQLDRAFLEELFNTMPPDELLKRRAHESEMVLRRAMPAEKIVKGIRLELLLKTVSADDMLAVLSPEQRAELAQRLREDGSYASSGGK
jgi:hypothetical protein